MQYKPTPVPRVARKLRASQETFETDIFLDLNMLDQVIDELQGLPDIKRFLKKLCKYMVVKYE